MQMQMLCTALQIRPDDIAVNPYNHLLYKSSYLSVIPVCYAIYRQNLGYSFTICSVLCTSLLYWKKPTRGLRRNIDMIVVNSVFVYHSYKAIGTKYARKHYLWNGMGILCYGLSWFFQFKNHLLAANIMHMLLHIFANVSNIYLISG